jgi:hypothetical protein
MYDYSKNYARIPAAIIDKIQHEPLTLAVYNVLVRRVRWDRDRVLLNGRVIELEAGQCVVGRDELAAKLHTTPQRVRSAFVRLSNLEIATSRTTNAGTIVTLCGYAESLARQPADQPAVPPAVPPAGIQRGSTNKILDPRSQDPEREPHTLSGFASDSEAAEAAAKARGCNVAVSRERFERLKLPRLIATGADADAISSSWCAWLASEHRDPSRQRAPVQWLNKPGAYTTRVKPDIPAGCEDIVVEPTPRKATP